jgi:hypothetical protein
MITVAQKFQSELGTKNYSFIPGSEFSFGPELRSEMEDFWKDWENLRPDNYLKSDDSFRLRRLAYFRLKSEKEELQASSKTAFFQTSKTNSYAGGVERSFDPILKSSQKNDFLRELIKFSFRQFMAGTKKRSDFWEIDVHQIRIIGSEGEIGQPTPEGIHQDDQDFVCIFLVGRKNVCGGLNTIYDLKRRPLTNCELKQPMDSILLLDPHVMHGVSPIKPRNPKEPAIRDVLLLGFVPLSE